MDRRARLAILGSAGVVASLVLGRNAGAAADLTGRWRIESLGSATLVDVTQTGSTFSFVYDGSTFTATLAADGSYTGSGTPAPCPGMLFIRGRVLSTGTLFDGRIETAEPPSCGGEPALVALSATRCSCDDGNVVDGDGCSADCRVEPCWTCTGSPSNCAPSADGATCDDGKDCTTGTTCSGGVCGGGNPVVPCVDMTGVWSIHEFLPGFNLTNDFTATITQRGGDVVFGAGAPDFVGSIDPATGAFDVRAASAYFLCEFEPFTGTVAPDGNTLTGTDVTLAPTPTHCMGFAADVTGHRGMCGDGVVDAGETCDDGGTGAGDGCSATCQVETCWACTGAPSACAPTVGAACDDGNDCTTGDTCGAGAACIGTPVADGTACDAPASCTSGTCTSGGCQATGPIVCPACTACSYGTGCVAAPQIDCFTSSAPTKATLKITEKADAGHDRLAWTWPKGDASAADFGDPTTDSYALCLYSSSGVPTLLFSAAAPAGARCGTHPCWKTTPKAITYANKSASPDGLTRLTFKPGDGKASLRVTGAGALLAGRTGGLPPLPIVTPLTLQLQRPGVCFETRVAGDGVQKDDAASGIFRAHGAP